MIALTLLGLMAGVVFSGFRMSLNSYERSQGRLEKRARERIMEDLVRRQLGSLFAARPAAGLRGANPLVGQPANAGLSAESFPLFDGTYESLTFVTLSPFNLMEHPGMAVVRYGLAEDELGRRYFGAMETRYTGADSFQAMLDIPPGKPLVILEGVEELAFQYYGYDPATQTYQWFEEWHGDEVPEVPEAIRIQAGDTVIVSILNANVVGGGGFTPGRRPSNLFQQLISR